MQIHIDNFKNYKIIHLNDSRFDYEIASQFKEEIMKMIKDGSLNFVINLKNVDFIDSFGLSSLVALFKYIKGNGDIVLCNLSERAISLLSLTRMDKIFNIFESIEEAKSFFNKLER